MAEYKCPKHAEHAEDIPEGAREFRIYGAVEMLRRVDVSADGEVLDYDGGDIEWGEPKDEMECLTCNYRGKITEFKTEG